jgi:hypothetical protein
MPNLKIVSTGQGHIYNYENQKRKINNANANIHFNKKYLRKKFNLKL